MRKVRLFAAVFAAVVAGGGLFAPTPAASASVTATGVGSATAESASDTLVFSAVRSSGPHGEKHHEYVQMKNVSTDGIDLSEYRLRAGTTVLWLPPSYVAPGDTYTIINEEFAAPCMGDAFVAGDFLPDKGTVDLIDSTDTVVATRRLPASDPLEEC